MFFIIYRQPVRSIEANEEDVARQVKETLARLTSKTSQNKNNKELFDAVNKALQELIADGTVQGIIDKYIPAK